VPRTVPQIASRLNREDIKRFLDENGVHTLRAPSKFWSETETAQLVNLFLVQHRITPQWVRLDGDRVHMTAEFARALALAAHRSGINRSYQEIIQKILQLRRSSKLHLSRGG
jgi:hypothetical protein